MDELPVVVVGAGPVGLAAAAELLERGLEPLVLERGAQAGAAAAQWNHVRLFSSWSELVDPAAARLLEPTGWTRPDAGAYPTGREWAQRYLRPLAEALGDRVRFGAEVGGVGRRGRDRIRRPRPHRGAVLRARPHRRRRRARPGPGGDRRVRDVDDPEPPGRRG